MERSDFKVHESPRLEEKYYEITHRSGLRIYIHPKDFSNTVAMLTVLFGSSDREFVDGSGGRVEVPAGSAHFLEHKMFETEDGEDIFYVFSQYGANSNAFTSNEITSYYFSCTDCFRESLGTLLGFVLDPHFTRESVEKEKDILPRPTTRRRGPTPAAKWAAA